MDDNVSDTTVELANVEFERDLPTLSEMTADRDDEARRWWKAHPALTRTLPSP